MAVKFLLCLLAFGFQSLIFGQNTIVGRFDPPQGFTRTSEKAGSFGHHLRNLPLKPKGAKVKYYNGEEKTKPNVYCAVVDLPIGQEDLHQCADAIIRLYAEYLYGQQRWEDIHFNFTNGFKASYSKWMQGHRIKVKGNKTWWVKSGPAENNEKVFNDYLNQVFMYAGTASLSQELIPIAYKDLNIGDILIKGGFPGHAVIVVDKAVNPGGKMVFMLAQSYMPAQEIQILINPHNNTLSPWYEWKEQGKIFTPEWTFTTNQLMRLDF